MPVAPDHDEADHQLLLKLSDTVERILVQTTATNGKVLGLRKDTDRLSVTVEGDPNRRLPSGELDRGLVGKVHDQTEVVRTVQTAITIGKRVAATLGAVALGLFGNLAAGLLA